MSGRYGQLAGGRPSAAPRTVRTRLHLREIAGLCRASRAAGRFVGPVKHQTWLKKESGVSNFDAALPMIYGERRALLTERGVWDATAAMVRRAFMDRLLTLPDLSASHVWRLRMKMADFPCPVTEEEAPSGDARARLHRLDSACSPHSHTPPGSHVPLADLPGGFDLGPVPVACRTCNAWSLNFTA